AVLAALAPVHEGRRRAARLRPARARVLRPRHGPPGRTARRLPRGDRRTHPAYAPALGPRASVHPHGHRWAAAEESAPRDRAPGHEGQAAGPGRARVGPGGRAAGTRTEHSAAAGRGSTLTTNDMT